MEILKPGGSIFLTTENRTIASWLVVIVAAEYIFKKIPFGTHEWNKFITPHEVQHILDDCKFYFRYYLMKTVKKLSKRHFIL